MIGRRGFITGLISLVAAPAIVRVGSLMPVKVYPSSAFHSIEIMIKDGYVIDLRDDMEMELDRREGQFFADQYGLRPPAWPQLTKWLRDMRIMDEDLARIEDMPALRHMITA